MPRIVCLLSVFLLLNCFVLGQAIRTPNGKIFTTSNGKIIVAKMNGVSVVTNLASTLVPGVVPVSGIVKTEESATVTDRGIVWSATDPNPTLENKLGSKSAGTGTGTFTCELEGLSPGVKYLARAYAKVDNETRYGIPVAFTIATSGFSCGTNLSIDHKTENGVAPEAKLVDYGTVEKNIGGQTQCWITQNLGASKQAISSDDNNKLAIGWFWQFNKKQGYLNDDNGLRQPQTSWISSVNESTDWDQDKDPCTNELGKGWRIPTNSEWESVQTGWTDIDGAHSVLKIHATGNYDVNGDYAAGSNGTFWSSTQKDGSNAYSCIINSGTSVDGQDKANGLSVRCLKGSTVLPYSKCGDKLTILHQAGDVAPENRQVSYGTTQTNFWGGSQCWITQNLGAIQQAATETDTDEKTTGWYWQFNRKQGYRATEIITPVWNSIASNEDYDWLPANDPCTIGLGSGWRIPTDSEWNEMIADWPSAGSAYKSNLKLHAAGSLNLLGQAEQLGTDGFYWSGTQKSSGLSGESYVVTTNPSSTMSSSTNKDFGYSLRCIIGSEQPSSFAKCGDVLLVNHKSDGPVAPEDKRIYYKTIELKSSGSTQCWIAQNLGASRQPSSKTDTDENATGWHWQFNIKKAYNSGNIQQWNTLPIDENINWKPENDPCTLELGPDWRMPSKVELEALRNVVNNFNGIYNAALKLYPLGWRNVSDGQLLTDNSFLWCSNQSSSTTGFAFNMGNYSNPISAYDKSRGHSARCLKENPIPEFTKCGDALTVVHHAGEVAPETKRISYGTAEISFWGQTHCMITQNLGATKQAISIDDKDLNATGWFWQFNKKQGFQSTKVPDMIPGVIGENSDWNDTNDPCSLELGADWRIPTMVEWNEIGNSWLIGTDAFNSSLKLHQPGSLSNSSGISQEGLSGSYWSSTQTIASAYSGANHKMLSTSFDFSFVFTTSSTKSSGFSLRCIRFSPLPAFSSCGDRFTVNHLSGEVVPDIRTIHYQTAEAGGKCWITQNLGASTPPSTVTDNTNYALGAYWQFNRKQGYLSNPKIIPDWNANDYGVNEAGNWQAENDPCMLELGNGWRLPTPEEWSSATSVWNSKAAFESILNIRLGGYIFPSQFYYKNSVGSKGYYWTNIQGEDASTGKYLYSNKNLGDILSIQETSKTWGLSVRCVRDL